MIRKIQRTLNDSFNWDTKLDQEQEKTPLFKDHVETLLPSSKLNETIYGKEELEVKIDDGSSKKHITDILTKVIQKGTGYIKDVVRISKEFNQ